MLWEYRKITHKDERTLLLVHAFSSWGLCTKMYFYEFFKCVCEREREWVKDSLPKYFNGYHLSPAVNSLIVFLTLF